MIRTMLRRTIEVFVILAIVVPGLPGLAVASGRDEAFDLARTIRALGYADEALQIEQVIGGMSDSDLQLLDGMQLGNVNAKLQDYIAIKTQVDGLERVPITSSTRSLQDFDFSNFPQPDYPPQDATCVNPVGETSSAALKVGLKATVFALREALTVAEGVIRAAMPACNAIVIAIGVGGNAASACVVPAVAWSVADAVLVTAEIFIDNLIFCDEQVHFAESATAEQRAEYLSHQVELHDLELGEQLATHDQQVQAKLNEAIARAATLEGKIDLGLKTQLELAMDRKAERRPAIFYMERLDELCDLAQESIDDLPPIYDLSPTAQSLVSKGKLFKVTDPKRAADMCTLGFNLATTGSAVLH